jgi:hypothetical protein
MKIHRLIMAKGEILDSNLTGYSTTPSEVEYVIRGLESKLAKSDAIDFHGHGCTVTGMVLGPPAEMNTMIATTKRTSSR